VGWLEDAAMTNREKAQAFLSKVFNGADARIDPLSDELAKMFDQCEEEGKVKHLAAAEAAQAYETAVFYEERAAERSPQAADEDVAEPVKHGAPRKVYSGKPHPKKKK
jgi:hypothetical protein